MEVEETTGADEVDAAAIKVDGTMTTLVTTLTSSGMCLRTIIRTRRRFVEYNALNLTFATKSSYGRGGQTGGRFKLRWSD
jgi:hypothetical protein